MIIRATEIVLFPTCLVLNIIHLISDSFLSDEIALVSEGSATGLSDVPLVVV